MSWHMSSRYGHVILVSGYPVLTAVNWPYCECQIYKIQDVDLPRNAWDTPPSLLMVSPTLPLQSVDAHVRTYAGSVTWQPNEKRLTIYHEYEAQALSHAVVGDKVVNVKDIARPYKKSSIFQGPKPNSKSFQDD